MTLIEQKEGWQPKNFHGEVALPNGADVEETIASAIYHLLPPQSRPAFRDIKYQIKPTTVIVANGKEKLSFKKVNDRTVFFELD